MLAEKGALPTTKGQQPADAQMPITTVRNTSKQAWFEVTAHQHNPKQASNRALSIRRKIEVILLLSKILPNHPAHKIVSAPTTLVLHGPGGLLASHLPPWCGHLGGGARATTSIIV